MLTEVGFDYWRYVRYLFNDKNVTIHLSEVNFYTVIEIDFSTQLYSWNYCS